MEIIHKTADDLLQDLNLKALTHDVNKYSRKFYTSVLSISDLDHDKAVKNILNMLRVNFVLIEPTKLDTHNISNNKFARIVLYNTMKYVNYKNIRASTLNDLHSLLLSKIDLCQNETKHVLVGLQSLYKEQEFNTELYTRIMIMMRKLFYSPLEEIQVASEKIIVTIIASLSDTHVKAELMKFLNATYWDCHSYFIVAKLIDKFNGALWKEFYEINTQQVFKGLSSNYSSHSASILFTALINKSEFEIFKQRIFPILHEYLKGKDVSNRTLSCSIIKYILPTCSDKYRPDFYDLCRHSQNLSFSYLLHLISYNYLKYSIPKSKYIMKICMNVNGQLNFQTAFGVLCRYNKLNTIVLESEFAIIKSFLRKIENFEHTFINNFQYFLSHLSVTLNDLEDGFKYAQYLEFFTWLYVLCLTKLAENCEENTKIFGCIFYVVLQILTGSSQELKLTYNLPKNKNYNAFENPVYLALIKRNKFYFTCEYTIHKFLTEFINRDYYVCVISKVISNYLLVQINHLYIRKLEDDLDSLLFTSNCYAGNRSHYCTDIILKYYSSDEIKCKQLFQKMASLIHLQFSQIMTGNIKIMFEKFPLFVVMQCTLNIMPYTHLENEMYLSLFAEIQTIVAYILENVGCSENEAVFLESKSNKAIEHTIIICLDLMYSILTKMEFLQDLCKKMLEILEKVITDSNKKRPVSHAAAKLELLLNNTSQHRELYMTFYNRQESCFKNNSERNTKIRRKPGTRLILHTLLRGIENQNFLNSAVQFLIHSGHSDIPDSVTAALHTLESLVSDSNFKSKMAVYIPQLLSLSLLNLDSPDFAVKNASMQLFQAITARLLGQKSEEGRRPLSAVEIFLFYPEIKDIMLSKLLTCSSGEDVSKIAILSFLSETDYNKCMHCETVALDFNKLKSLFYYPDIARFAVRAYVAVCPSDEIFDTILSDVNLSAEKLLTNEKFYRICAIEQLYKRFTLCYPNHENTYILNKALSHNSVTTEINLFRAPPYAFLLFILNNAPPYKYCKYLSICLKQNHSELFLLKCLGSITEKCKDVRYKSFLSDLTVILINFLTTLSKPSTPLVLSFYKIIMLLFESQNNLHHSLDNKLVKLTKCVCKCDVYTQHIWLVVYGYKPRLSDEERNNVSKIISSLARIAEIGKPDECYQVCIMLKDLFVLLEDKEKINFLYLLIALTLRVEEMCELDEFFYYLSGKNLPTKEYMKWVFTVGKSIFLKESVDIKLFSCKLLEFISRCDLRDAKDDNFYSKSDLFTEKLSFVVCILSLLCKLYV